MAVWRFNARPSALSLLATGSSAPLPEVAIMSGVTPFETSKALMAAARRSERPWL